jgi:hypothetical protein
VWVKYKRKDFSLAKWDFKLELKNLLTNVVLLNLKYFVYKEKKCQDNLIGNKKSKKKCYNLVNFLSKYLSLYKTKSAQYSFAAFFVLKRVLISNTVAPSLIEYCHNVSALWWTRLSKNQFNTTKQSVPAPLA